MEVGENKIIVDVEGGVYTAVLPGFKSYETDLAGFGDDELEAVLDLILQLMKEGFEEH